MQVTTDTIKLTSKAEAKTIPEEGTRYQKSITKIYTYFFIIVTGNSAMSNFLKWLLQKYDKKFVTELFLSQPFQQILDKRTRKILSDHTVDSSTMMQACEYDLQLIDSDRVFQKLNAGLRGICPENDPRVDAILKIFANSLNTGIKALPIQPRVAVSTGKGPDELQCTPMTITRPTKDEELVVISNLFTLATPERGTELVFGQK